MSNIDRYTYDNYIQKPHSEKIVLAHIEPKERLIKWELHAGFIYKRVMNNYVINLIEDKLELTQVQSLAGVDEPSKWFFDIDTKTIYYWSSDGSNPEYFFMLATLRFFFSNAPVNLPLDLNTGRHVEYEPLIHTISKFTSELDEDNIGIALEGKGKCSFHNIDGRFDDIFDILYWVNCKAKFYSWNRLIDPNKAVLLFSGRVKDKQYKSESINFQLKDFVEILRDPLLLPLFSESDGDISETWIGKPKRRIYGRVAGLKLVSVDSILSGFTLSGLYSITGGSDIVTGNENAEILDELTPQDEIFINDSPVKIKKVYSNYFKLVDTIPQSYTDIEIKCYPLIPYRNKNRQHLIACHSLREPTTTVTRGIVENIIEVDSVADIESEDYIYIGIEFKKVKRIVKKAITLYTNLSSIPVIGTIVKKLPIHSVYFEKNQLLQSDFSIENLESGSKLIIDPLAEFNLTQAKVLLGTLTFVEDSRILTTAKLPLSGDSIFTKDSTIVKSNSTAVAGGSVFTNNSRYVNAGNIAIDGELQFTNGSKTVTTKKNNISGKLKFTKDSKSVVADVLSPDGKPVFTNSSAIVQNKGSVITGDLSFRNNSVKVKTRSTQLTGRLQFTKNSNIVRSETKSVQGRAFWINGSQYVNMIFGSISGISITFTNGSNSVIGVGTNFLNDVSVGDYLRPIATSDVFKIDSIVNNNEIKLIGIFTGSTSSNPSADLIESSNLTNFVNDLNVNDWIRISGSSIWYQVQVITDFEQLIITTPYSEASTNETMEGSYYSKFNTEMGFGDFIKLENGNEYYLIDSIQDERELRLDINYPESTGSGQGESAKPFHLTAFQSEIEKGQFIKPVGNGDWYRIGEVVSNYEINLDNTFQEIDYDGDSQKTSDPSYFSTQLSVGEVVRVPNGSWYEIDSITNNSELILTSNYLEVTITSVFEKATEPSSFLSEIQINDYIRPNNIAYDWYQVKRIDSSEQLTLYKKFKNDIDSFSFVTSTPTFFIRSIDPDKVQVGDSIKPNAGGSFFEVDSILNDYQLELVNNFTESTQSGLSSKSTNPTQYLSDVSVNEWIIPEYKDGKYYQVQQIISDTSILLYERFDEVTTPIVSVNKISIPTKYLSELETGDKIQLEAGSEWYEVKEIYHDGKLDLTFSFTKTTANGLTYKQTPGAFLTQLKPRDWISPNGSSVWYEILEIESNTRMLLREDFRESTITTKATMKNVEYINDESNIVVDTFGKTQNGIKTGDLIRTGSDVIKDLMIDANLESDLNLNSFSESSEDAPYLISLALPKNQDGNIPKYKDVVEYINQSIFGSLYNDNEFKINFSVINTRKPEDMARLDDSDIIKYSIKSKSNKIIKEVIVKYKAQDFDVFGKGQTYKYKTFTSNLIDNLQSTFLTKTIEASLFYEIDANVFAQRYIFFHELSKSIITLTGKMNISNHSLNDIVMITLDRMYRRIGSTTDNSKIAIVSSVSKSGIDTTIKIDDLSNAFNRIANITSDTANNYSSANDNEKIFNGYITDQDSMISDLEITFGINLIG